MRFSLIMPTLGRRAEVVLFLQSLKQQTFSDFELIVVDQNEDSFLQPIIAEYHSDFKIVYIKSLKRGLSLNRNEGLKHAQGNIVAFPDDDCVYQPDTLAVADRFFSNESYRILTMNTKDQHGSGAVVNLSEKSSTISFSNFLTTGISFTIFVQYERLYDLHFDEKLGVGARFGSSEESDFMLNLLMKGYPGFYNANYYIYHPAKVGLLTADKGFNYGLGMGAMFKKHIVYHRRYSLIPVFLKLLIKSTGGIILTNKRSFYYHSLRGRITGFLAYKR